MPAPAGSVTLRPLGPEDIPRLDRWRNDLEFQSEYGDFLSMHRRQTKSMERWQTNGLLGEDQGMLLICLDDEPVGALQWHQVNYGPNEGSRALNIGVAVEPSLHGRGIGTRAQRQITEYLFAHTLAHRIEAITDVTNVGEQKALDRAGWTREGVLRGAQFRLGEWHDMVVYSRLRTDV